MGKRLLRFLQTFDVASNGIFRHAACVFEVPALGHQPRKRWNRHRAAAALVGLQERRVLVHPPFVILHSQWLARLPLRCKPQRAEHRLRTIVLGASISGLRAELCSAPAGGFLARLQAQASTFYEVRCKAQCHDEKQIPRGANALRWRQFRRAVLLVPQRFDGVEVGGAQGGGEAAEDSDQHQNTSGKENGGERNVQMDIAFAGSVFEERPEQGKCG
jgi:hypothetical protein